MILLAVIAPSIFTSSQPSAIASASVKSVLSTAGKAAYDTATAGGYFEVSAADYAAAYSGLASVTKVGTSDASIAACSYSWSAGYGTVMNNTVMLPANAYILGFASGFYTNASTPQRIRLISASSYKGTYDWFTSESTTSTGVGAKYYLFKSPATTGANRYLGHWSSFNPCATSGSFPTAGYYSSATGPWPISNTYTSDIPNLQVMYTTIDQWTPTPATITLSIAGGVKTANKGVVIALTSTLSDDGLVTFKYNGKNIGNCVALKSASLTATCNWKPTVQGNGSITATLRSPTSAFSTVNSTTLNVSISKRLTLR